MRLPSPFPFQSDDARTLASRPGPPWKPRPSPVAGITGIAQGGSRSDPVGRVSRGASGSPERRSLPPAPVPVFPRSHLGPPAPSSPAQPHALRSDFASTFPRHLGRAAASVPPAALATSGAPRGPPPAPCAAFPKGLQPVPHLAARAPPPHLCRTGGH
ncbi:cyclin-K-like [Panthera pardus]|uniref:Cyclin-K-like n=1 Tax=Panthera pardus TaxID=9691 RepID=A0A9W2VX48_PANPR|nr:cyclin-K-like [Panthera pardus]